MAIHSQDTPGGHAIIIVSIIFTVIITIFVALRLYVAYKRGRLSHLSELCVMAAWTFTFAFTFCFVGGAFYGGSGEHLADIMVDPKQGEAIIVHALKNFWASTLLWGFATASCKLAVLMLYREIFTINSFRRACHIMIAIVLLQWLGNMLATLLSCRPIAKNWYTTMPGQCGDSRSWQLATACINMVIDAVIAIMPAPVIWNLQMPWSQRVGVGGMFGLGLIVSGLNASRVAIVVSLGEADFTYAVTYIGLPGGFELWLGTIVACLPPLRTLFTDPSFRSGRSTGSNASRTVKTSKQRRDSHSLLSYAATSSYKESGTIEKGSAHSEVKDPWGFHSVVTADDSYPRYPEDAIVPPTQDGAITMQSDVSVYYSPLQSHGRRGDGRT